MGNLHSASTLILFFVIAYFNIPIESFFSLEKLILCGNLFGELFFFSV